MKILRAMLILFGISSSLYAQEKFVTTSDSVKLYINVKGEGAPCLFIHGGPGQGSYYWEILAGDFSERNFKMIYLDQRGCGRSSSPQDSNYTLERMIKDFEEVREALHIEEWFIMGHSFGGILQVGYAKKHPKNIKGMLMFNCTLNMKESLENSYIPSVMEIFNIRESSPYTDHSIPLATRLDSLQKIFMKRSDTWKLSFESPESQEKFAKTYSGFQNWNTDFSRSAFLIDDYLQDYTAVICDIKTPVLFLYGKNDRNTE